MINTIIFDLGNVLIKWEPRIIYKNYFESQTELDYFFDHVCTLEWNEEQDAGRTVLEATELKVSEFPSFEEPIRMYYDRWKEMITGSIEGTPDILKKLHLSQKYRLLALTNWSAELFPYALETFEFLSYFEGILVSGEEKMKKPNAEIYERFAEKFNNEPTKSVFIDDSARNIIGAKGAGWNTIHFQNAEGLKKELIDMGVTL